MLEAIILAGGFGTRLKSVVPDLPKPMAPVAGRPFLEILLTSLSKKGFCRAVLSLGYLAESVVNYFGSTYAGIELIYEIEDSPLGTGGALRQAITKCISDHVYVFNGDTFIDVEILDLELLWEQKKQPIIVAREVGDISRFGCLITKGDKVSGFCEKGASGAGLINAGCYVMPSHILDGFESGQQFSLEKDFLESYVRSHHLELYVTNGYFIDIGIPEDFQRAQSELKLFEAKSSSSLAVQ